MPAHPGHLPHHQPNLHANHAYQFSKLKYIKCVHIKAKTNVGWFFHFIPGVFNLIVPPPCSIAAGPAQQYALNAMR